jgi:hypothetical protein
MLPRGRRQDGLTMVEIVVCLSLLAVAVLMIESVFFCSLRSDGLSRERQWARQACRQQLEAILSTPFSSVKTSWNGATFDVGYSVVDGGPTILLEPAPGKAKVGTITVDDAVKGEPTCLRVTVTAEWRTSVQGRTAFAKDAVKVSYVVDVADH